MKDRSLLEVSVILRKVKGGWLSIQQGTGEGTTGHALFPDPQ